MELKEALEIIKTKHIDKYGFIVQGEQDPGPLGDSAQRLAFLPMISVLPSYIVEQKDIDLRLINWPNFPRRHPEWKYWDDFSRDQACGVICYLLYAGQLDLVRNFYDIIKENKYRFPNKYTLPDWWDGSRKKKFPDIITPGFVAMCRRADCDNWFTHSWITLLDSTETLFALYRKYFCKNDKHGFSDDVNLFCQAWTCNLVMPTFFSRLTWKIVKTFIVPRMDYYFDPKKFGPPLNVIVREIVKRY